MKVTTPNHFDVIIIGTGAGGGTLAYKLAPSGLRILILERGDFIPKEKENWDPIEVFTKGRYRTTEQWYDQNDKPFSPFTHYCVGGNTKLYGSALFRLRETDFQETRHYGGISPAWPIRYQDLEPYYTEAEKLYSVHGQRGVDPTEPSASAPYPYGPIVHEPRMKELYEDIQRLGFRPFPLPIGVRLADNKPYPQAPVHLSNFDGFPDLTEAKADAHVVALNPALAYPNVTLLTNALVEKLETDVSGKRVNRVVAKRNGQLESYSANVVVVACGAVNSAALLLKSANEKHPNGLANSSDQVGRNYMKHLNGTIVAISDTPNNSVFQKSFGIADFYHNAPDSPYPLGAIQLMGKTDPDTLLDEAKDALPNVPLEYLSTHSIDFWLTSEDLPSPDNRVTVRPDGSIRTSYTPNNTEAYDRLKDKLLTILRQVGMTHYMVKDDVYVGYDLGISGVSHQAGTCRFGIDPKTSVLDINCKAHDLDNLYVVDSSFFVSSGAFNPSLTIIANALRVGDHLLGQLKAEEAVPEPTEVIA
ncbi:GMC family oxidoreductase [Nibrella viscosa]|uniref:GMC family oxidoreductase n=1 Tax=Nibrella viscosa TaxID=1084524 RepID=A0ABP8KU82_9BACT